MNNLVRLLQKLDYMRMVVGICIILDGYPLIFFFRETLGLAHASTAFTALAFAGGLMLMVPFTVLRKLYRPNVTMFWMGVSFILLCIFYMYFYNPYPFFALSGKHMVYYLYIVLFLFLLINVPNDIIPVFIPVVVIFTLVSNLGLVYALITDPTWAIGQRATITLNNGGDSGSGNPHAFSRNAFMGVVACVIWLVKPKIHIFFRLLTLFAGILNIAILVLTQTRSAIVALMAAMALFMYFNVRPAQVRAAVRGVFRPIPILVMMVGVVGVIFFFQRYSFVLEVLLSYVSSFAERNLETLYALLGLKSQGADYRAVLDDSTANRSVSAMFFRNVLAGHLHMLILGYGYDYLYMDVPILEALCNYGLMGFALFGGINGLVLYHSWKIMRHNPNPLSVFLAYFYMLILVQILTNGRPNEISFWFPMALMIRFIGIEHLFPAYLSEKGPPEIKGQYVVIPHAEPI